MPCLEKIHCAFPLSSATNLHCILNECWNKSANRFGFNDVLCLLSLNKLTQKLKDEGVELFIETSGAYPLTGTWDWICLSPKKNVAPLENNYKLAHELKVIVFNNDDFKFAEEQAQYVNSSCKLYLQPEWSKLEQMLPSIIEFVKNNPKWNISLQTHKYMRIP